MAVPSFLTDATYDYLDMLGVTDVADILTQLSTSLLAHTPAWTEPSAGTFKSPVESGTGRYFQVAFTADSTTRLSVAVTDWLGRDIFGSSSPRKMDIVGTGDKVSIYFGSHHLMLETLNPSTTSAEGEHAGGGMLDLYPEANDAHHQSVWATARRSTAGSPDTVGDTWADIYMIDNGAGASRLRPLRMYDGSTYDVNARLSGTWIFNPVYLVALDYNADPRPMGRMYHAVTVPDPIEPYSQITLPLSTSPVVTGVFRVTNRRELNLQRMAWRIG